METMTFCVFSHPQPFAKPLFSLGKGKVEEPDVYPVENAVGGVGGPGSSSDGGLGGAPSSGFGIGSSSN